MSFRILLLASISLSILVVIPCIHDSTKPVNTERDECTIGVANGTATSDGRPLLWKTRDYSSARNNEVYYNDAGGYSFVGVVTANGDDSSLPWMGLNEHGFAIVNSLSSDLQQASGSGNGTFMYEALQFCRTIADFDNLLNLTNGQRSTHTNYGVIDANGGAALYEVSGYQYWKYDTADQGEAPNGYIVKTNFAHNGDGSGSGHERYNRAVKLASDYFSGDSLNHRSILRHQMRDFSDSYSNPVSVPFQQQWLSTRPYGYIYTGVSICRSSSVSAAVIHGVKDDEPAMLTTMWTILGQPATGIAVPYWPVGDTPPQADGPGTAPLANKANEIRSRLYDYSDNTNYLDSYKLRDEQGNGLWARTFPAEDSIFAWAEQNLAAWRNNAPTVQEILDAEQQYASYAYTKLNQAYMGLVTSVDENDNIVVPAEFTLKQNYPNPFNPATTIQFELPRSSSVNISIFDIRGRKVKTLVSGMKSAGVHSVTWNGKNDSGTGVASGVYIYRLRTESGTVQSRKMILAK